ncbi:MAG: hypothetical protein JJT89_10135 [Nitriliruptoraceae bacterium]|nr:hypothetical protein [Nitriliruptoraceae bacterium]
MSGELAHVLDALDEHIRHAITTGDRRGYFAVLYRRVTQKVEQGIEDGFFDDAERMVRLDAVFAERYLDAMAARDVGAPATASWELTFDAAEQRRPLVLQHLLVAINAHINLDLGIAAAECSPGEQLPGLRRDFDRINAILAAAIGTIQADLTRISPWIGMLDRVGGRTSTELIRFSIVTARAGAWRFATELDAVPAAQRAATIAARDAAVARVGQRVLAPGGALSTTLLAVGLRERRDVAANIRALLGTPPPSLEDAIAALGTLDAAP